MYSGIDDPSRWSLPAALEEQATRLADKPWIVATDGETWTFGDAWHDVRRAAGHLAALGVSHGEPVVLVLGNHVDFVRAWLGVLSLGAIAVLLNPELRGAFLAHQLASSQARLAIVDADRVDEVERAAKDVMGLSRFVIVGSTSTNLGSHERWDRWRDATPFDGPLPLAREIACVMYTSGTSGPSKGVQMPHAHCALYGIGAIEALRIEPDDRYYIVLPLFHSNGLLMQLGATLIAGITAIVRPRFSASRWLADVREHRATLTNCLGALAAFIGDQPPSSHDRDHRLRAVLNGPNLPAMEAMFRDRFGVASVVSGYGMTEVNIPVWGRVGTSTPGASGWVTRWFDLIVADPDTDVEVPRGTIGEILVRPRVPWCFMASYQGMPDKTVEAWRNLWFHTGDAGTMDEDGLVAFVDRLKDCIRRRGENIAATEVEALLATLPGVAEVAAYAVPSDIAGGEDELMLAVIPVADASITPHDIGELAERLLPRFARPRYVAIVDELPRTATGKVQRAVLRRRGVADALDRGDAPRRSRQSA